MTEFRTGSWNMLNAAGDPNRQAAATEVIKAMDVDVLYLSEMAENTAEQHDISAKFKEDMRAQGYEYGITTDYSPDPEVRNAHYMSMWARGDIAAPIEFGVYGPERYAMKVINAAEGIAVYGLHGDDISEEKRQATAVAITGEIAEHGLASVVMGDFNAMHRRDLRSLPLRKVNSLVEKYEVKDFYDKSQKVQRQAGKVIRLSRMADGGTMAIYETAGMVDPNDTLRPTIKMAGIKFNIDHIMVGAGLVATSFQRHEATMPDGKPISDHSPISVTLRTT